MASSFDLSGRRVVVTGSSSGIGEATAVAFAAAGARVAGISLDGGGPVDGIFVAGDTGDVAAVDGLAARVEDEWGGIDVWVNNAAGMFLRPLVDTTDEDWHRVLAPNLHGYFYGCRAAARAMVRQGTGGAIVNVSSAARVQAVPGFSAYGTAKGAIDALTRTIAVELAPHGIRVNAVAPGAIDTPLNKGVYTDEVRRVYEQRIPLHRVGTAAEIADVIVFFATDAARYVTGQELLADGGLTINGEVGHVQD